MLSDRASAALALLVLGAPGCAAGGVREPAPPTVFIAFAGQPAPLTAAPAQRPPLERPGHYRLAFSARREHGCSLSYATNDVRGEYVLDLAPDGRAALTLTSSSTRTFGSRMRVPGQGPDAVTTATQAASSWKGEAREAPGRLDVTLYEAHAACGAPGARCDGPKTIKLACTHERVDVAPAPNAAGATGAPVPVDLLRCKGAPSPFGDEDPAFAERLPLSHTEPLALSSLGGRWHAEEVLHLEAPASP